MSNALVILQRVSNFIGHLLSSRVTNMEQTDILGGRRCVLKAAERWAGRS